MAIELASHADDLFSENLSRRWADRASMSIGNLEEAGWYGAGSLDFCVQLRDNYELATTLTDLANLSYFQGNWDAARDFSNRGLAASPEDTRLLYHRADLEYEVGDFGLGEVYLERLLEAVRLRRQQGPSMDFAGIAMTIPTVAYLTNDASRFDVAQAAAEAVLAFPTPTPRLVHLVRTGLGLMAVQRGDIAGAGQQYQALSSMHGLMLSGGFISFDRLLGLLSQTMGNPVAAGTHFEDALAFCRKAGYRPELAWSCHDYAELLLLGTRDRARAIALLNESLAISTELGMLPLMERVVTLQERADSQPESAPAYPGGLTQREVEILRLIAAGKTDREIAEELIISIRTVGNHVSSILNKTAVANRTEAATYATRKGLV